MVGFQTMAEANGRIAKTMQSKNKLDLIVEWMFFVVVEGNEGRRRKIRKMTVGLLYARKKFKSLSPQNAGRTSHFLPKMVCFLFPALLFFLYRGLCLFA